MTIKEREGHRGSASREMDGGKEDLMKLKRKKGIRNRKSDIEDGTTMREEAWEQVSKLTPVKLDEKR